MKFYTRFGILNSHQLSKYQSFVYINKSKSESDPIFFGRVWYRIICQKIPHLNVAPANNEDTYRRPTHAEQMGSLLRSSPDTPAPHIT